MQVVTVWLPEYFIECIQELIQEGMYPDRSACIRVAIRDLLKNELKSV